MRADNSFAASCDLVCSRRNACSPSRVRCRARLSSQATDSQPIKPGRQRKLRSKSPDVALRTHCLLLGGVLGPLSTPFPSVRQPGYLHKEEEARGFASPPHDGFAFIAESTPTPKGDAPTHVQVDTTVGWASSSLGYLQEVFSETRLSLERDNRSPRPVCRGLLKVFGCPCFTRRF